MFVDSHAHLSNPEIYENIDSILERAQLAGITKIINICTDPLSLERGLIITERYPWVLQSAATTPHDVEKEGEAAFEVIAASARSGQLQAIGETGLDYFYEYSNRVVQKDFLRRYLRLALECTLPIIIHCREAFADLFPILDAEYQQNGRCAPGILHCFTGTMAEAEEVVKRGWMLSLSGIVTFKKSSTLQEVAKWVPLENLLIETDAPYLAPQKRRGKQNEPAFIVETAQFIAELKGINVERLAKATADNIEKTLRLKSD